MKYETFAFLKLSVVMQAIAVIRMKCTEDDDVCLVWGRMCAQNKLAGSLVSLQTQHAYQILYQSVISAQMAPEKP